MKTHWMLRGNLNTILLVCISFSCWVASSWTSVLDQYQSQAGCFSPFCPLDWDILLAVAVTGDSLAVKWNASSASVSRDTNVLPKGISMVFFPTESASTVLARSDLWSGMMTVQLSPEVLSGGPLLVSCCLVHEDQSRNGHSHLVRCSNTGTLSHHVRSSKVRDDLDSLLAQHSMFASAKAHAEQDGEPYVNLTHVAGLGMEMLGALPEEVHVAFAITSIFGGIQVWGLSHGSSNVEVWHTVSVVSRVFHRLYVPTATMIASHTQSAHVHCSQIRYSGVKQSSTCFMVFHEDADDIDTHGRTRVRVVPVHAVAETNGDSTPVLISNSNFFGEVSIEHFQHDVFTTGIHPLDGQPMILRTISASAGHFSFSLGLQAFRCQIFGPKQGCFSSHNNKTRGTVKAGQKMSVMNNFTEQPHLQEAGEELTSGDLCTEFDSTTGQTSVFHCHHSDPSALVVEKKQFEVCSFSGHVIDVLDWAASDTSAVVLLLLESGSVILVNTSGCAILNALYDAAHEHLVLHPHSASTARFPSPRQFVSCGGFCAEHSWFGILFSGGCMSGVEIDHFEFSSWAAHATPNPSQVVIENLRSFVLCPGSDSLTFHDTDPFGRIPWFSVSNSVFAVILHNQTSSQADVTLKQWVQDLPPQMTSFSESGEKAFHASKCISDIGWRSFGETFVDDGLHAGIAVAFVTIPFFRGLQDIQALSIIHDQNSDKPNTLQHGNISFVHSPWLQLSGVISTRVRYPPHAGMYLEEHFIRASMLSGASDVVLDIDWLGHEHNVPHRRNIPIHLLELVSERCCSSSVATILQVDYEPVPFCPDWIVLGASGTSRFHNSVPLMSENIPWWWFQSKSLNSSDPAVGDRVLTTYFAGRETQRIRQAVGRSISQSNESHLYFAGPMTPSIASSRLNSLLTSAAEYSLAPRGNGPTSFRLLEALQGSSIPVYIWQPSFESEAEPRAPVQPFEDVGVDLEKWCIQVSGDEVFLLPYLIGGLPSVDKQRMRLSGKQLLSTLFEMRGAINASLSIISQMLSLPSEERSLKKTAASRDFVPLRVVERLLISLEAAKGCENIRSCENQAQALLFSELKQSLSSFSVLSCLLPSLFSAQATPRHRCAVNRLTWLDSLLESIPERKFGFEIQSKDSSIMPWTTQQADAIHTRERVCELVSLILHLSPQLLPCNALDKVRFHFLLGSTCGYDITKSGCSRGAMISQFMDVTESVDSSTKSHFHDLQAAWIPSIAAEIYANLQPGTLIWLPSNIVQVGSQDEQSKICILVLRKPSSALLLLLGQRISIVAQTGCQKILWHPMQVLEDASGAPLILCPSSLRRLHDLYLSSSHYDSSHSMSIILDDGRHPFNVLCERQISAALSKFSKDYSLLLSNMTLPSQHCHHSFQSDYFLFQAEAGLNSTVLQRYLAFAADIDSLTCGSADIMDALKGASAIIAIDSRNICMNGGRIAQLEATADKILSSVLVSCISKSRCLRSSHALILFDEQDVGLDEFLIILESRLHDVFPSVRLAPTRAISSSAACAAALLAENQIPYTVVIQSICSAGTLSDDGVLLPAVEAQQFAHASLAAGGQVFVTT